MSGYQCGECGMPLGGLFEFHPYAACQVYLSTAGSNEVWRASEVWRVIKPMLEAGIAGPVPHAAQAAPESALPDVNTEKP